MEEGGKGWEEGAHTARPHVARVGAVSLHTTSDFLCLSAGPRVTRDQYPSPTDQLTGFR